MNRNEPNRRILITAGPTHEPIDEVRFIGNRSSGRLGTELARAAAGAGWETTLLLGPATVETEDTSFETVRFRTTTDLQRLLTARAPACDVLVMAAAVADYRPVPDDHAGGKITRGDDPLVIRLEPTPDLLAAAAAEKRSDQLFVGFALEPRERLMDSARRKLAKKKIDAIVANPLETMDAGAIEAVWLTEAGDEDRTAGPIPKRDFAPWLLERVERALAKRTADSAAR